MTDNNKYPQDRVQAMADAIWDGDPPVHIKREDARKFAEVAIAADDEWMRSTGHVPDHMREWDYHGWERRPLKLYRVRPSETPQ